MSAVGGKRLLQELPYLPALQARRLHCRQHPGKGVRNRFTCVKRFLTPFPTWVLSRTAASASPTRTVLGMLAEETSTSTGMASMPTRGYEASLASMIGGLGSPLARAVGRRCRGRGMIDI